VCNEIRESGLFGAQPYTPYYSGCYADPTLCTVASRPEPEVNAPRWQYPRAKEMLYFEGADGITVRNLSHSPGEDQTRAAEPFRHPADSATFAWAGLDLGLPFLPSKLKRGSPRL